MPLTTSGVPGVLTASAVAATVGGVLWLVLNEIWLGTLESMPALDTVTTRFRAQEPFLFAVSVMLFLLVLSVHYVAFAIEAFRTAERQQLELQVLTRDAELRALRAQVNPHFLYNSLNSISALTGSDPAAARRMCLLLAEFLRTTLRVSTQERIPLAEELTLVDRFLSIEQVRFGARLQVERSIDESALECQVPPLVLQPLLENAVFHGVEPGTGAGEVLVRIERRGDRVLARIENPYVADQQRRVGNRMALENIRERLALFFDAEARIETNADGRRYRVEIEIPYRSEGA
jgi:LytS/YehU family sensor histidine kinase